MEADPMPNLRMCSNCRAFLPPNEKICPYCGNPMDAKSKPVHGGDERVAGFVLSSRLVSSTLMLLNFGFFLLSAVLTYQATGTAGIWGFPGGVLNFLGAKSTMIQAQGEWWRLITAGVLHGGLIHIGMNTWVLFDVGPLVEEFYGAYRMVLIYVIGSVVGFGASLLWSPGSLSIGASAGITALIGAMIAYGFHYRTPLAGAIRAHFVRWAIYLIVIGLIIPVIDNAAHIGGLAGGFAIAYLTGAKSLFDDWKETTIKILFYLTCAVVVYAFFQVFQNLTRGAGA
ncbi:MAG: rhomboid family intramembrane serine protease [Bryobacterales bacterium]|nr:rhomboid family intramembrane serine protease [Bryobacterales bacterium]